MATVTRIRKKRKYRKSDKIRKNSVQGRHDLRTRQIKGDPVWLTCRKCEIVERECESGVISFICARCAVVMVPFPVLKPQMTEEEKSARRARANERRLRKEATARGEKVAPSRKDLGFGRGWHKKILFKTGINGSTEYYTKGEKITKKEYDTINREQKKAVKEKKKNSFGRGWHFKAVFIAPNGDRYEKGKLAQKVG